MLTWVSNNDAIASVSNGIITAHEVGEATITVTGKNTHATLNVVVEASTIDQLKDKVAEAQQYIQDNPALHEFLKSPLDQAIKNAQDVIDSDDVSKIESALQELSQALANTNQNVHFVILQDNISKDLSGYDAQSIKEFSELQKEGTELLKQVTSIEDVSKD